MTRSEVAAPALTDEVWRGESEGRLCAIAIESDGPCAWCWEASGRWVDGDWKTDGKHAWTRIAGHAETLMFAAAFLAERERAAKAEALLRPVQEAAQEVRSLRADGYSPGEGRLDDAERTVMRAALATLEETSA